MIEQSWFWIIHLLLTPPPPPCPQLPEAAVHQPDASTKANRSGRRTTLPYTLTYGDARHGTMLYQANVMSNHNLDPHTLGAYRSSASNVLSDQHSSSQPWVTTWGTGRLELISRRISALTSLSS